MTKRPSSLFLAAVLAFGITAAAQAQVVNSRTGAPTGVGGTASSGTGVRTGQGPLSQPVPPASSSISNSQQNQNQQGTIQRPQGSLGPVQTVPPQKPFGQ